MGEVSLAEVRHLCQMDAMCWTEHAGQRLIQRQISPEEVIYTLLYGSIVEQYPTDSPYPKCRKTPNVKVFRLARGLRFPLRLLGALARR